MGARSDWRTRRSRAPQKHAGVEGALEGASADRLDQAVEGILGVIVPLIPSSFQSWKPGPQKAIPEALLNPLTGAPLNNPWESGDMKSQALLLERQPDLAELYRKMSEDPFGTVFALRDQDARRKELAGIVYGAEQHRANPFTRRAPDDAGAMAEQAAFIASHSPTIIDVWKLESRPISFPWSSSNLQIGAQSRAIEALNARPVAGLDGTALIGGAASIDDGLRAAQQAAAEEAARQAADRARQLASR